MNDVIDLTEESPRQSRRRRVLPSGPIGVNVCVDVLDLTEEGHSDNEEESQSIAQPVNWNEIAEHRAAHAAFHALQSSALEAPAASSKAPTQKSSKPNKGKKGNDKKKNAKRDGASKRKGKRKQSQQPPGESSSPSPRRKKKAKSNQQGNDGKHQGATRLPNNRQDSQTHPAAAAARPPMSRHGRGGMQAGMRPPMNGGHGNGRPTHAQARPPPHNHRHGHDVHHQAPMQRPNNRHNHGRPQGPMQLPMNDRGTHQMQMRPPNHLHDGKPPPNRHGGHGVHHMYQADMGPPNNRRGNGRYPGPMGPPRNGHDISGILEAGTRPPQLPPQYQHGGNTGMHPTAPGAPNTREDPRFHMARDTPDVNSELSRDGFRKKKRARGKRRGLQDNDRDVPKKAWQDNGTTADSSTPKSDRKRRKRQRYRKNKAARRGEEAEAAKNAPESTDKARQSQHDHVSEKPAESVTTGKLKDPPIALGNVDKETATEKSVNVGEETQQQQGSSSPRARKDDGSEVNTDLVASRDETADGDAQAQADTSEHDKAPSRCCGVEQTKGDIALEHSLTDFTVNPVDTAPSMPSDSEQAELDRESGSKKDARVSNVNGSQLAQEEASVANDPERPEKISQVDTKEEQSQSVKVPPSSLNGLDEPEPLNGHDVIDERTMNGEMSSNRDACVDDDANMLKDPSKSRDSRSENETEQASSATLDAPSVSCRLSHEVIDIDDDDDDDEPVVVGTRLPNEDKAQSSFVGVDDRQFSRVSSHPQKPTASSKAVNSAEGAPSLKDLIGSNSSGGARTRVEGTTRNQTVPVNAKKPATAQDERKSWQSTVIIVESSDEEEEAERRGTQSASEKREAPDVVLVGTTSSPHWPRKRKRGRPKGAKQSTVKQSDTKGFNHRLRETGQYNFNYSEEDAQREQERLLREAADRVRAAASNQARSQVASDIGALQHDHWKASNMYHRLGLGPGAPINEVKRRYRRLALAYHPDKGTNYVHTTARFQAVTEAYKMLCEESERL